MRLDDHFTVAYGNKFDLNKMVLDEAGVNFVGRSGRVQGVSARVARVHGVEPYEAGLVTVALGGASRLTSFVQAEPFYTAQNVAVLRPVRPMATWELLYWSMCIKANAFRYGGFGREANRTLSSLELPDAAPLNLESLVDARVDALAKELPAVDASESDPGAPAGTISDLFRIRYGHSLELNRLRAVSSPEGVNFVSRTDRSNGIAARVAPPAGVSPGSAGELTVALSGNPLGCFLQTEAFVTAYHVAILSPRTHMTDAVKLWYAMCIRANRFRYSYGRQANRTLAEITLPERAPGTASAAGVAAIRQNARRLLAQLGAGDPDAVIPFK